MPGTNRLFQLQCVDNAGNTRVDSASCATNYSLVGCSCHNGCNKKSISSNTCTCNVCDNNPKYVVQVSNFFLTNSLTNKRMPKVPNKTLIHMKTCFHHTETNQLIWIVNQLSGFYIREHWS